MNKWKSLYLVLIFALFASFAADAQEFLFRPYLGKGSFVELPGFGCFREFETCARKEIPLGLIELDHISELGGRPLEVRLLISNSNDWHLRFYAGTTLKGYLFFNVEHGLAMFKGMYIKPHFRNYGLSRVFFKYYALFCEHFGLEAATAIIYKPLMARVVMGFGFVPSATTFRVIIRAGRGRELRVFPVGFELEQHLIDSQHMIVLDEAPSMDAGYHVFINTRFRLPQTPSAREEFWAVLNGLPGRYFLYRNDPPILDVQDLGEPGAFHVEIPPLGHPCALAVTGASGINK